MPHDEDCACRSCLGFTRPEFTADEWRELGGFKPGPPIETGTKNGLIAFRWKGWRTRGPAGPVTVRRTETSGG